jgi:DNA-binding NarL/FixJ family response regulator
MATVLIIDPHPLNAQGMEGSLTQAGHTVVGVAHNGLAGLDLARSASPHLIILDLEVPRLGGLDLIKRIIARKTATRVLVFTALPAEVYEPLCIAAGASGFVDKTESSTSFSDAVNKVLRGKTYFQASALRNSPSAASDDNASHQLTAREITVLHYLAEGYRVKQIAGELAISDRTVSTYKSRLLEKTGTHSLVDLLQVAVNRGLLEKKPVAPNTDSASLSAAELDFNALLDKIPFPVCLRASDARILAANQTFLDYLGLPLEAVIHARQCDIGVIDTEHLEYARKTFNAAVENRIPYMMVVVVSLRGERRVLKHGGCPVLGEDGELVGMLCSFVDIGEEESQIQALRDQMAYRSSVYSRRGAYLIQQGQEITDYLDTARKIVARYKESDDSLTLLALLEHISESVRMVSEMVDLEQGNVRYTPFPQNLNALTETVLNTLSDTAMPPRTFLKASADPWGWIDATPYTNLLNALMLHLKHEGAGQVSIHASAIERDAGHLDWALQVSGTFAQNVSRTPPVIYLAMATKISALLHGDLVIAEDDDQRFEAQVTLKVPVATSHPPH